MRKRFGSTEAKAGVTFCNSGYNLVGKIEYEPTAPNDLIV